MTSSNLTSRQPFYHTISLVAGLSALLFFNFGITSSSLAEDAADLTAEWGGYIRSIGTLSYPDDRSVYQFTENGTFNDRQAELRLNHRLFLGTQWTAEVHYELAGLQGDTLKNNNRLRTMLPTTTSSRLIGTDTPNDDRRLMNLTHTLSDGNDHIVYHRLDRFNLTHTGDWGTLRMGRQALTWGNGLLFNPMDLFNPFAPTAIQRDYKAGDDMLHLQWPMDGSEVQLLYVPRRDTTTGDIESDQSSFAGKWHAAMEAVELDFMVAYHCGDVVLATGASGYWGGAAWRGDIIYTMLDDDHRQNDFWQWVANLDYAWQWGGKNIYGLIEFYYNGIGNDRDYAQSVSEPSISRRIERGELFTLAQTYLAGQIQVELHPLVQAHLITIINLADPSAIVQPQLGWDIATNFQLIAGATFNRGGDGTEFGGFDTIVAGTTIKVAPADTRYIWLTYYF